MNDEELRVRYESGPEAEMIGLPACAKTQFCHLPEGHVGGCEVDRDKWKASSFDKVPPRSNGHPDS